MSITRGVGNRTAEKRYQWTVECENARFTLNLTREETENLANQLMTMVYSDDSD